MVIDLMAAFLIFVTIAGSIMWVWDGKAADAENRLFENERFVMAQRTLDTLIRSQGMPENWETVDAQSIKVVGIAKRDLVIDKVKANKFKDLSTLDYDTLRTKLLIGGNEYYFRIAGQTTTVNDQMTTVFKAGKEPEDDVEAMTVRRPVIYTYRREGEDLLPLEENPHEAIAELTLYTAWRWRG